MALRSIYFISAVCVAVAQSSNPFSVSTTPDGAFSISVPGWEGLALDSASDIGVQVNGQWLAAGSGLTASAFSSFEGSDV